MTAYGAVRSDSTELTARLEEAFSREAAEPPQIPIAVVGGGWIGGLELDAYRSAGFNVVAIVDRHEERALEHRDRTFPDAQIFTSVDDMLHRSPAQIVDFATHVGDRSVGIATAVEMGRHVLSQKPFAEDLHAGTDLRDRAAAAGVLLAVNQNGRWAPHFGAMLRIVTAGIVGEVVSADFSVAWGHEEVVKDRPAFANMDDLVLFDFGAHWFDIVGVLAPEGDLSVRANVAARPGQQVAAPLQADVLVAGARFRSAMSFRAGEQLDDFGGYRVSGTNGVVSHRGEALGGSEVRVTTPYGTASISIADDWFRWGLAGAMGELLHALSEGRSPSNDADSALRGLSIAFGALQAARTGDAVAVGGHATRY